MNNKGFTLVELLAVMVILTTISFVAVGNVTNSLAKREKQECENQKELAIGAAKIYFSLNKNTKCVTIDALLENDFLETNDNVDKCLERDNTIKINNGYIYSETTCPN